MNITNNKKTSEKKLAVLKKALLLFLSVFLFVTTAACSSVFNKFRKGFYFEKYGIAQEAQEALLEAYPIGSSVKKLVKILEKAGSKCGTIINPEFQNKSEYKNLIYCDYYKSKFLFFSVEWRVLVRFTLEKPDKISSIKLLKFFHVL